LGVLFPPLARLPYFGKAIATFKETRLATMKVIQETIDSHKSSFQEGSPRDFIDLYLSETHKITDPDSSFFQDEGGMYIYNTYHYHLSLSIFISYDMLCLLGHTPYVIFLEVSLYVFSFSLFNTEKQLGLTMLDLFIAGAETTSTTLTWTFLYLALNQEVQDALFKEIMAVVGDSRLPSLADRPK
jgi:hypothetical protein